MKKENKYIDMQYLNEVSPNKDFQHKIFQLFRGEVLSFENQMKTAYETGNFVELADLAHKAKSSVSILGMKKQAEEMKQLQNDINDNVKKDTYLTTITSFIEACYAALEEISEIEKTI
jgi:HPt (histidine-containing phosphotransfer) domain-containing protein